MYDTTPIIFKNWSVQERYKNTKRCSKLFTETFLSWGQLEDKDFYGKDEQMYFSKKVILVWGINQGKEVAVIQAKDNGLS